MCTQIGHVEHDSMSFGEWECYVTWDLGLKGVGKCVDTADHE